MSALDIDVVVLDVIVVVVFTAVAIILVALDVAVALDIAVALDVAIVFLFHIKYRIGSILDTLARGQNISNTTATSSK